MPFITIDSFPITEDITPIVRTLSERIGKKSGFPEARITIKWTFSTPAAYFRSGSTAQSFFDDNYELVVTVTCSAANGNEKIADLVQILVSEISDLLNFDQKRISVIINAKEQGRLFVNNRFI